MDRIDAMAAFIAVAEAGAFVAAARRLGRSPAGLTRAVAALEERLGTRLFTRTTRVVALTDAGRRYLGPCQAVLRDVAALESSAETERREALGLLVVTASVVFGRLHVLPIVADFRVARVSLSSGLLRAAEGGSASAMSAIPDARTFSPQAVRTVWAEVARAAGTVSLFRIDSLVWQVGEPLYAHRSDRHQAQAVLRSLLEAYGAEEACAQTVAHELTFEL